MNSVALTFPNHIMEAYFIKQKELSDELKKPSELSYPFINENDPIEKELYHKLLDKLKGLEKNSPVTASKLGNHQTYAIIFRVSESWKDIQQLFTDIITNALEQKIKDGAFKWINLINQLRHNVYLRNSGKNSKPHYQDEYSKLDKKQKEVNEEFYGLYEGQKAIYRNMIVKLDKQIEEANEEINGILKKAEKLIEEQLINKILVGNSDYKQILNFIKKKWGRFCLFVQWEEVDIDTNKIYGRVEISKDKDSLIKEATPVIKDKDSLIKEVTPVIKAIYIITDKGNTLKDLVLEEKICPPPSPLASPRGSVADDGTQTDRENILFGIDLHHDQKKPKILTDVNSFRTLLDRIVKCAIIKTNNPDEDKKDSIMKDYLPPKSIYNRLVA